MEAFFILLILGFSVLPIIAIILALSAKGRTNVLEERLNSALQQLSALKATLDGTERQQSSATKSKSAATSKISEKAPLKKKKADKAAKSAESEYSPPSDENSALAAATTRPKRRSAAELEKLIGARWSVILGGIAVALGAVFLVRYTIEAGLLGPRGRIAMGFVLSAALFAGGEWLRRHDRRLKLPVFEKADVPGILTGAGAVAAFATLYAAYALYDFIGPALAFIGLTLIGLGSLLLSSLHGPKLAAIGMLGAYIAPALVSTSQPNPYALAIHVLVVTASVMATARIRGWLWLAVSAIVGGIVWTVLEASISTPQGGLAGAGLLIGLSIIYTIAFGWQAAERPQPLQDRDPHQWSMIAFSALAFAYVFQAGTNSHLPELVTGLGLGLVIMFAAITWPAMTSGAFAAAVIVIVGAVLTALPLADLPGLMQTGAILNRLVPPDINSYLVSLALLAAPPAALAVYGAFQAGGTAPRMAGKLAAAACLIGFLVLLVAYMRIAPFQTRLLFGAAALAGALGAASLVELFTKLRPDDITAPAPAAFAVASVAFLSFAIGVSLSKAWMPFGFALSSLGIAFVYSRRPVAVLPWLCVIAAGLAGLALWFSVPFHGAVIGKIPLFNNLIILAGLPAAALLATGELLRRDKAEPSAAISTAVGLAALGLFVALEIRHWLHGGEIASRGFDLADMSAQTIAALFFAIGLQRVAKQSGAKIFDQASIFAGGLSAFFIAAGLLLVHNPFFTYYKVGATPLINMLLPAYLIPAILAGIVALMAKPIRPRWYTLGYALLGGLLIFVFVTATTRHAFQGTSIGLFRRTSDLEFWTYSAVWLVLGAGVLGLGLWLKSLPVRIASGVLIALTICKVFILDLGELTGALRAFSFLGLGASLILIGRYYQHILIRVGEDDTGAPLDKK